MPPWTKAKCNNCDFSMPLSTFLRSYIVDDNGEKISLRHPGENATIKRVLGDDYSIELLRERIRHISWVICLDCLHEFNLDMKDDSKANHVISNRTYPIQQNHFLRSPRCLGCFTSIYCRCLG